MTTELDKARRALQASFNLGIARGVEFVTNIEALIRAILAEQDGGKNDAVLASEQGEEAAGWRRPYIQTYSAGEAGDMVSDAAGGWMDRQDVLTVLHSAEEALRSERAAREKAERERDEALKWNKIAMEQVAARDRQIEKAEAELAALRDIFVWIEDGPGLECIPNDNIQEAIHRAIPNIKTLARERRAARAAGIKGSADDA